MMKVDKERIPEQEPKAENETYNYERFRIGLYEIDPLTGPRTGEKAPDFAAETVDGHKVHLSNYLGHPVVLITGSYTSPQYIDKIETMNRILYRHPEAMFPNPLRPRGTPRQQGASAPQLEGQARPGSKSHNRGL